ncbi:ZIP family metal transporter, partial [bacterium]|nr:ZIP family metal transporter [bacterium]
MCATCYLIFGIFLHNFPEGMAIAIGAVTETKVSLIIALAIAIHNIPEGICTSAPYYHSTGDRLKAFLVSSSTAVPLLIGYLLARYIFGYITPEVLGFIIGATAGLMI